MKAMPWGQLEQRRFDQAPELGRGWLSLAALLAASFLLSACATMGPTAAAPEGEAPQEQTAQAAQAAGQRPAGERPPGARPGAGLMSPLATAGYIPLKMIPCSLGAVGSFVGFLFTLDARMLQQTVIRNCGGDWVITPGMLEGTQGFRSVGRIRDLEGPPLPPPPAPPPDTYAPPIGEPGGPYWNWDAR